MTQTAAVVFNTVLILLEDCMLLIITGAFFEKKRRLSFVNISFVLAAAISCAALYVIGDRLLYKLAVTLLVWSAWVYVCYRATAIRCVFSVLFWIAYLAIADNILLSLLSGFAGKSLSILMSDPNSYYFICFSAKTVELFGMVLIRTWIKRHFDQKYTSFQDWLRVLAFPLLTLIVSLYLFRIYYMAPQISFELTVCNAIMLTLDITSILVLNYLEKQQEAVRDNIILRQNMKAALDNVEALKSAYDGQRKLTHDFGNQLLVIGGMIKRQAPSGEILEYIKRLQDVELQDTMRIKTRRTAVDVTLNQKFSIAEGLGIRFDTQLDDLSEFPLADDEVVIVLSNLVDNAIEACEKIQEQGKRYISLKMRTEQQAAFLHIENSTAEYVHIQDNRVVTTKQNPLEHGFGLQNVVSVLKRNDAMYLINYDDLSGVFSFSSQIPI